MELANLFSRAIQDPNRAADAGALGGIADVLGGLAGSHGVPPQAMHGLLDVVGGVLRDGLQQHQDQEGQPATERLLEKYAGTGENADAVGAVLTPEQQSSAAEQGAERTGLPKELVMRLLPALVPIALSFLHGGRGQAAPGSSGGSAQAPSGGNPILDSFLGGQGGELGAVLGKLTNLGG